MLRSESFSYEAQQIFAFFTIVSLLGLMSGVIVIGVRDFKTITNITNITNTNITNELTIASFTPAIGSTTVNFTLTPESSGYYTQLDNLINVFIYVVWNSTNSINLASTLRVLLPFPIATSGTRPVVAFTVGYVEGLAFTNQLMASAFLSSPSRLFLWSFSTATVPIPSFLNGLSANATQAGELAISGSYITDVF